VYVRYGACVAVVAKLAVVVVFVVGRLRPKENMQDLSDHHGVNLVEEEEEEDYSVNATTPFVKVEVQQVDSSD
jgi:uncharacterized sodium:solute symporter family permease YidK